MLTNSHRESARTREQLAAARRPGEPPSAAMRASLIRHTVGDPDPPLDGDCGSNAWVARTDGNRRECCPAVKASRTHAH
ncbi:hypothetical protein KRMM14A1004_21490 [Krasilnikovia sp. MM14-A1004]